MTLGAFHVGIIDAVIVVIGLLFAVAGFKHGFFKEIVGIGAFVGALALAYLLSSMVESLLVTTPVYPFLFNTLRTSVFTGNALFETVIDSTQPGALQYLTDGLTQIGLPGFLAAPLANLLITFNGTLGDALATSASYFVILIGSYVITFLVGWLLLFIVLKQLVRLSNGFKFVKLIDSLLGLVLGLVRAALIIGILMLIAIPVSFVVPAVNDFLTQDLALGTEAISLGKYLYELILGIISVVLPN